jgi:hypothetical protein
MIPLWHPLRFLLVALAGWINQQQRDVIDYLQEEDRVLREQLGRRRVGGEFAIRVLSHRPEEFAWRNSDRSHVPARFTHALGTRGRTTVRHRAFSELGQLWPASTLRRDRRLMQPTAVRLPAIRTDTREAAAPVSARCGRAPIQSRVGSVPVVIPLEIAELCLQISGRPEQRAVQTFAPDGPNQPFYERMRERDIRHGLALFHLEDP